MACKLDSSDVTSAPKGFWQLVYGNVFALARRSDGCLNAFSLFFVGGAKGGDGFLLLLFGVLFLRNGGGIGLIGGLRAVAASNMFSAYALIWTLDGFRAMERASCVIALLGLQ